MLKKVEKLEWKPFFNGDIVLDQKKTKLVPILITGSMIVLKSGVVLAASSTPVGAAGAAGGLATLLNELLVVCDYIAWGGMLASGLSWVFGNKTVAIERAVGVTCGYLIIRKSWSYIAFLKSI